MGMIQWLGQHSSGFIYSCGNFYPRIGRSTDIRITMVRISVIATMIRIGRGLIELVGLNSIRSDAKIP